MNRFFPLSSLLLPALLLAGAFTVAKAQQGQTGTDPKSPFWIWLPQTGSMQKDSTMQGFGSKIYAVGDVDRSGTQDFIIIYSLDTTLDHFGSQRHPIEYRLYKGVSGGLPRTEDGVRIGVDEIGAEMTFGAAGDWNNDGNVDLIFSYILYSDTSFGNGILKSRVSHLVVFWGNERGEYSTADITRLSNGVGSWEVQEMVRLDADNDGIDDLFVRTWGGALRDAVVVATPKGYVLPGRAKESWGDTPVWEPTLRWWEPPVGTTTVLDHDVDGHDDLIFRYRETGPTTLRAIYGREGLFDTSAIMTVDLAPANGQGVAIGDITGDNVPELLMTTGSENIIRIYAGRRGQRLDAQFGSGFEGPHPERGEWWHRPWAELWMAPKLDDGFFGSNGVNVLADANLDGINDIWTGEPPWLIAYVAGDRLDSLIDVFVKAPASITSTVNLGDIDKGGRATLAVYYGGNEVLFVQTSPEVSSAGKFRRLPHLPSSVNAQESENDMLDVQAVPNPASGDVHILWGSGSAQGKSATVRITDALGQKVLTTRVPAEAAEFVWDASRTFGGRYFITTLIDDSVTTTAVVIR